MKARLFKIWTAIHSSYWFIPSLMALSAIVLSFVTTSIDASVGPRWIEDINWLYANRPDGARALLSTIAGSMITVAGVTFSITIAAVAYATNTFGPRLLTNFMQDRGNQVTLGTFIATFLYCLLVLRTIRSAEEPPVGGEAEAAELLGAFVPHLAILCGLILALASIGVLIYFIHHVPESIHAANVTADIGRELNNKIDSLFPGMIGYPMPEQDDYDPKEDVPENFFERATAITADGSGYVQYIDEKGLLRTASAHDLLLRVEYRPGDFVHPEESLVWAFPSDHVDEGVADQIRGAFAWGRQRTQQQDVLFLVNELTEITARALSTGVNDPFTAMNCIDWLGAALSNLAGRPLPGAHRYDDAQQLRVIAHPVTFEEFAEAAFASSRPYVQADPNAALHMMKMMADVARHLKREAYQRVVLHHAQALKKGCEQTLTHEDDLNALRQRYRTITRLARNDVNAHAEADAKAWLGGRG